MATKEPRMKQKITKPISVDCFLCGLFVSLKIFHENKSSREQLALKDNKTFKDCFICS